MGNRRGAARIWEFSFSILLGLAFLAGLYLTRLHSYPLFHTLAELFAIVIAFSIFIVAWNARRFLDNNYLFLLGVAFLFIGTIDLLHMMAYKGLGIFPGYGTNLPTQLWIVARGLQATTMLMACVFVGRRFEPKAAVGAYTLLTTLLLVSVFGRVFPVCHVEDVGLTPFKIVSEYVIIAVLLSALVGLFHKKKSFDPAVHGFLVASTIVAIFSEFAFTLYSGVFDRYNMIGHLLKIVSFYFIYRAIIVTGFTQPYSLLFRELKEREDALLESEEKYRLLFDNSLNGFSLHQIIVDDDGRPVDYEFLQVNKAFEELTGLRAADVQGRRVSDILSGEDLASFIEIYGKVALTGAPAHFERYSSDLDRHYEIAAFCPRQGQFATIFSDVTERKNAEDALSWSSHENAAIAELSQAVISTMTIEEMSDLTLSQARRLTGSTFGFVGYIDPQTNCLVSPTMTREIWDACEMIDTEFVFHEFQGLWGWVLNNRRSILTNKPESDPRSSGIPAGHVRIERFMAAPALIGDRLVGIVALANPSADYGQRELVAIERMASLYALAIQRAELYDRERKIAETLQRSFLPDALPDLEGYQLADCYRPARPDEASVGGDVYDVFTLPDGRIALAIADVSGKGIKAARYGAMVKFLIRAYAYQAPEPSQVLSMVNESLARELASDCFVTCFLGILDMKQATLTYANAGHDEPLCLRKQNASPERLEVTGPILGAVDAADYMCETLDLSPGDVVLLYTDGVTDARGLASDRMGIEGLESLVAAVRPQSAAGVVECILEEVDRRSGNRLADDVAMLVLRVEED